MDILPLLIAYSLRNPFAIKDGTEKLQQVEPELPAIDFAQLTKVSRDDQRPERSRETFAGRPVTATM
jgi:hypothetical protein